MSYLCVQKFVPDRNLPQVLLHPDPNDEIDLKYYPDMTTVEVDV